jgi:hypothetical protein
MDTDHQGAGQHKLVERVKRLLLKPKEEWPVIAAESASISGLFLSYVAILAAIPAVAQLIGGLVFGYSAMGITFRPSIGAAIGGAIGQYVMGLLSVVILGLVIDALAPRFGAQKDRIQAFKVAAYASTAAWLAGSAALIPAIGFLAILGVYSLYLLYLGLPLLMKAPADKAVSYTVVVVVATGVLAIIASLVLRPLVGGFGGGAGSIDVGSVMGSKADGGSLAVPGVGKIDLGGLEQAAKRAEKTAQGLKDGTVTALPAEKLAEFLPETIGRFRRTVTESSAAGMGGIGGSHAEGRYEAGDEHFELSISDIPAVGPMAALGSAMGVKSERKTETGYQRTHSVDGNFVEEEWDGASKRGSYSVMVAERFAIKAEGRVSAMGDLTAAIAAARPDKIAGLAR